MKSCDKYQKEIYVRTLNCFLFSINSNITTVLLHYRTFEQLLNFFYEIFTMAVFVYFVAICIIFTEIIRAGVAGQVRPRRRAAPRSLRRKPRGKGASLAANNGQHYKQKTKINTKRKEPSIIKEDIQKR